VRVSPSFKGTPKAVPDNFLARKLYQKIGGACVDTQIWQTAGSGIAGRLNRVSQTVSLGCTIAGPAQSRQAV
jgi:hypothetical protein